MSNGKDPAFLFYSQDWIVGCLTLSMEERGVYITILAQMHQQGRLKEETIRLLVGSVSVSVKAKFVVTDDGFWYNERLENEMEKRQRFTESRRINGVKGGRPVRKEPNRNLRKTDRLATDNHMEDEIENNKSIELGIVFRDKEDITVIPTNGNGVLNGNSIPVIQKKDKSLKPKSQYHGFIDIYDQFFKSKTDGLGPNIDAKDGAAAKKIIAYLTTQCKNQKDDPPEILEHRVLASWKSLLDRHDLWDPFHQDQMKLTQISSNLSNIIYKLKNPKHGNGQHTGTKTTPPAAEGFDFENDDL